VPIRELLKTHSFGPDEIQVLVTAFEEALRELRLVDRTDPVAQLVAKRIIELAQQGERDPIRLREGAVQGWSQRLSAPLTLLPEMQTSQRDELYRRSYHEQHG
jgi:hypothetical protein